MSSRNGVLYGEGLDMGGNAGRVNQYGTNGFIIFGNSSGYAGAGLPTSSDGSLTFTGGAGTLDIVVASSPAQFTWSVIIASQALANNNGYICGTGGGAISLSLPSSAAVGTIIEVSLSGATSWTITQGAGQRIRLGALQTTSGVGGSLASTAQGDSIRMVCDLSGSHWVVLSSMGLLTIV